MCSLPLKLLDIKFLQECINLELIIGDNLCSFIILYRSASQNDDDFETFITLELNLDEINKKSCRFNAKAKLVLKIKKYRRKGPSLMF